MVRFMLQPLYSRGNIPHYPLHKRLGGPHPENFAEEEKYLLLLDSGPGFLGRPTPILVTVPTELPRFRQLEVFILGLTHTNFVYSLCVMVQLMHLFVIKH
jgi:hypothetical protein